ncbi:MAG: DMT family transporter [Pseudomonas sp.]|nr:DMT family transporter [Pseudomonas sp.]
MNRLAVRNADLMLLLVAIIWGTSYGVAKQALVFYPVLGFLFIRFSMTCVLLLPSLRGQFRAALRPGLPLGLTLLAIFLLETYGVLQTSASNAAFLISLFVVFTPFFEWLMFRRRPTTAAFLAAGLSLLGALLLTHGGEVRMNLGDWLMIGAALLRGFIVCLTKRYSQTSNVSALALTAVQTGVVASGCLLLLLALPGPLPALPHAPAFWWATAYLVVFCTLFAFYAQNYGVRRTTPTRASLLMGSEPLFGALFAVLWLGEQLSAAAWLGGLLIVLTSLWASRPAREQGSGAATPAHG